MQQRQPLRRPSFEVILHGFNPPNGSRGDIIKGIRERFNWPGFAQTAVRVLFAGNPPARGGVVAISLYTRELPPRSGKQSFLREEQLFATLRPIEKFLTSKFGHSRLRFQFRGICRMW